MSHAPGTGWVIKQNANDPRWTWTTWDVPLASTVPIAWNCSEDFDRNTPLGQKVRDRFAAVRPGDRVWAWQTDRQAMLGVLMVRAVERTNDGVCLRIEPTIRFAVPVGRAELVAIPEVAVAPPFKMPGRDYRLTISPLGISNERLIAALRPSDISDEVRRIVRVEERTATPASAKRRRQRRRRRPKPQ